MVDLKHMVLKPRFKEVDLDETNLDAVLSLFVDDGHYEESAWILPEFRVAFVQQLHFPDGRIVSQNLYSIKEYFEKVAQRIKDGWGWVDEPSVNFKEHARHILPIGGGESLGLFLGEE